MATHVCFSGSLACSGCNPCRPCFDMRVRHIVTSAIREAGEALERARPMFGGQPYDWQRLHTELAEAIFQGYETGCSLLQERMTQDPALAARLQKLDLSRLTLAPVAPVAAPARVGYAPAPFVTAPSSPQVFVPPAPVPAPVERSETRAPDPFEHVVELRPERQAAQVLGPEPEPEPAVPAPIAESVPAPAPAPPAPVSRPNQDARRQAFIEARRDERRRIAALTKPMDAEEIAAAASPVGAVLGSVMLPAEPVSISSKNGVGTADREDATMIRDIMDGDADDSLSPDKTEN